MIKKYIVQGHNFFGWTNLKSFVLLKSAINSCENLKSKGLFSKTRVVIEENGEYIRVYPPQRDKEGNAPQDLK